MPSTTSSRTAFFRHRDRDPVLVLLAPAEQADVRVFEPQEEFHASVRLIEALYHLCGKRA